MNLHFVTNIGIDIYINLSVPKSIDFGWILGYKKGSILGPLYLDTLHTCPYGKHILGTLFVDDEIVESQRR